MTYTVRIYQRNADDDGYSLVRQQVVEGVSDETAEAPTAAYDGFTENEEKSVPSGIVTGDGKLVLTRYVDRKIYAITFVAMPVLETWMGAAIE